jgi:hypothetical protein
MHTATADERLTAPPPGAHPKILAIHRYWQSLATGRGRLPSRTEIDPVEIPALLENVWLVDILGAPPRFRMRLAGETLRRMGFGLKRGDYLESYMAPDDLPLRHFRFLAAEGKPVWFRGEAYAPHASTVSALERIALPLAADGATVDAMLCLTVFFTLDGREV